MSLISVNAIIAAVIFFTGVGCVKAMNGVTCDSVRWAVIMVMIGAGGQALGVATGQWDAYLDTILYGGILAVFLANKRSGKWIPISWAPHLSAGAMIGSLAIALGYWLFG